MSTTAAPPVPHKSTGLTVSVIFNVILVIALIALLIWMFWPGSTTAPSTPSPAPYTSSAWATVNPGYKINGYTAPADYQGTIASAPLCATAVQTKAQAANSFDIIGWDFNSAPASGIPAGQGLCRGISKATMGTTGCLVSDVTPADQYAVGGTMIGYSSCPA